MKRAVALVGIACAIVLAGCGTPPHRAPVTASVALPGGAGTDPTYRGPQTLHHGPVQTDPKIVLVYWGSIWQTGAFQLQVRQAERTMLAKLPGSGWGAILGQYGVHDDITLTRAWADPRDPPATKLGYKAMLAEAHRASLQTGIQPGLNVQWILFLPPTANLANFTDECGEHDSNTRRYKQTFVYALVQPFDTQRFGSGDTSCAQYDGFGNNKVAATTSLTSHEIAEAATDPLGTGYWSNPAAKRFGQGAAEDGDECYAQGIQPWGASGPTVQALWSDRNAGPLSKLGCVASLAGGAPRVVGQAGPSARPGSLPAASPAARKRLQNS